MCVRCTRVGPRACRVCRNMYIIMSYDRIIFIINNNYRRSRGTMAAAVQTSRKFSPTAQRCDVLYYISRLRDTALGRATSRRGLGIRPSRVFRREVVVFGGEGVNDAVDVHLSLYMYINCSWTGFFFSKNGKSTHCVHTR